MTEAQFDEQAYLERLERHHAGTSASFNEKMEAFPRFVSRQVQSTYLYRWELFKQVAEVPGSIVELGVWLGFGVFSFANFSVITEPFNHPRQIIGFDTFTGFPSFSDADLATEDHAPEVRVGGFYVDDAAYDQLLEGVAVFDANRPIPSIPKIRLVRGDVMETLPRFLEENPHLLLAMLYVDLDLYEPCKFALELLYDRVVPGGIIAFDELNYSRYPGETTAYLETLAGRGGRLRSFPFEPLRCYLVKD